MIDRAEETENVTVAEKKIIETVDISVKWSIINNKQYFDRLKSFLGTKRAVSNTIAAVAFKALRHRDHSDREDLYLIDARTGKEEARNVTATERLKVPPTEQMKKLLAQDNDKQYVLFHNHPLSSPPSVADLNSLYKNPKIKLGVIVGHDGTAYKYTAPKEEMEEHVVNVAVGHYLSQGYSYKTAEKRAYDFRRNVRIIDG